MRAQKSRAAYGRATDQPNRKRRATVEEPTEPTRKSRRLQQYVDEEPQSSLQKEIQLQGAAPKERKQLPSPSPSKTPGARNLPKPLNHQTPSRKRKAESSDTKPIKRTRGTSHRDHSICHWLSNLPLPDQLENMSRPPSKRSRSRSSDSSRRSPSHEGAESTVSRDAKYSAYKDSNYAVVLETKHSFMCPSEAGIVDEDRKLCRKLLCSEHPPLLDSMFQDKLFERFHNLLQGRSEARVYLDLHPLLVPSAETLFVRGNRSFHNLIQGYNDPWIKAIPFYGPRPQPDHTVGLKWSSFTDEQRRKLRVEPNAKSYYTAREDIYFPFLTSEIKCGKQALDLADRPNAHSMTIAVRAIVELYRRAKRESEVHRRILAFSISHDDKAVRIYGHYAEIDGLTTAYYRHTIKEYIYSNEDGTYKWTAYRFTFNVYSIFAPEHLERIKSALDQLPDPADESLRSPGGVGEALSSQDMAISALSSQDSGAFRARGVRTERVNPELRAMIQNLENKNDKLLVQLDQQREEQREEAKIERDQLLTRLQQLFEHRRNGPD
ncbi:MAG: hypothetical protein M4579_007292 [Chaenotheca gracillima]|nr:MAG: hypothetical protein M4579_007292 [Chaenotheca gracillima]